MVHYDVLLSYPNETNASYISIMDEHGIEVMWNCWYFLYLLTPVVYVNWDVGSSKNGNWLTVQWDSLFFRKVDKLETNYFSVYCVRHSAKS